MSERTFHFRGERETDTNTTICVESTQEAATMEDAWCKVADALGGRMAYLTDNLDDWVIWIEEPGHQRRYVTVCPECGGNGVGNPFVCAVCRGSGFVDHLLPAGGGVRR